MPRASGTLPRIAAAALALVALVLAWRFALRADGLAPAAVGSDARAGAQIAAVDAPPASESDPAREAVAPAPSTLARPAPETSAPAFFHGRAVEGESGRPIAGAELFLAEPDARGVGKRRGPRKGELDLAAPALCVTDREGRFRIPIANWHVADVYGLRAPDRAPSFFLPTREHEREDAARDVELWRAASVVLRVRGFVRDAPARFELVAAPAALVPFAGGSPPLGPRVHSAALDARGEGEVDGLPPRVPLELVLLTSDHERLPILSGLVLAPGERRAIDFDFAGGAALAGRVVDQDGTPVAGLALWLGREGPGERGASLWYRLHASEHRVHARATTDPSGAFAFDGLPPGRWWLGPIPGSPPGRAVRESERPSAVAPVAEAFELAPGEARDDLELVAWRGLFLECRVEGRDGRPEHAWIDALCEGVAGAPAIESLGEGRFLIGPTCGREHELFAWSAALVSPTVRARPGDGEIVLRFPAGGAIAGEVVDPSGAPIGMLRVQSRALGRMGFNTTCVGGSFALEPLAPGEHTLLVVSEDGRAASLHGVEVRAGETARAFLELAPAARVELRLAAREAAEVELLHGDAVLMWWRLEPGDARALDVPAGRIRARVRGHAASERAVELAPGGRAAIELAVDGATMLSAT